MVLFRRGTVLLLHRHKDGEEEDWVLPGGQPEAGEGTAACARREVHEETGLRVDVGRVAFVLETIDPEREHRVIEIVFLASRGNRVSGEPIEREPGLTPVFVPVDDLPGLNLRPPLGGYLRGIHGARLRSTAAYLGNLWRASWLETSDVGR